MPEKNRKEFAERRDTDFACEILRDPGSRAVPLERLCRPARTRRRVPRDPVQDPDIILVGELRDLETVAIAMETAEPGHLVFGTLHTTTAASTIDRVIDQFPSDRQAQIASCCRIAEGGHRADGKIGGGRVAALEVLIATQAVSNPIREGKTFQLPSIIQVNKAAEMVSLNDALLELVTKRLVEPAEAYARAVDKAGFEGC